MDEERELTIAELLEQNEKEWKEKDAAQRRLSMRDRGDVFGFGDEGECLACRGDVD